MPSPSNVFSKTLLSTAVASIGLWTASVAADGLDREVDQWVEQVTVTGTRLQDASPAGLVTIDRDAIRASGATTLSAVFRDLVFAAAGTVDEQFTQGFAPASAAANLRGLGVSRTLVLLDGRRLPIFPFAQEGSQSFVDLNLIPLGSVERIEVLTDGASAIYGADAVAGVVNVITRRPEAGTEVSARISQASEGDGEEAYLNLNTGWTLGDVELGFNLDYMDRGEIWARDRDIARSANGPIDARSPVGNPGTFITSLGPVPDAACPAESLSGPFCTYDFAPDVTLVPAVERLGVAGAFDYAITPMLGAFARVQYTDTESERDLAAAPNGYPVSAANPNNPFGENVIAVYRVTELGPRRDRFESEAFNFVAGLTGAWNEWLWEAAAGVSNVETPILGVNGYGVAVDVQAAIDAGTLNVFGPSPNFDPATVMYQTERTGESDLTYFDAKMNGRLFEVAGMPVNAAFGVEYRQEEFSEAFDPRTAAGEIIGVGGVSADGDRDVFALFAEFALPLSETFDLTLAGRYDDYSDFGGTFNPKLAARWTPSDAVTLHASVATGFKAPALHELYAGNIAGFTAVFDTTNCTAARAASDAAGIAQYCDTVQEVSSVASGNEELDAEESDSASIGVEWSPVEAWQFTATYWQIENENAVVSSPQFFIDNEARFPGNVVRNGAGDIASVSAPFENVAAQELWGMDFGSRGEFALGDAGMAGARFSATYLGAFDQQPSAGEPTEDLSGADGYPEWRARVEFDWSLENLSAALAVNWVDGYTREAVDDEVDAWTTVDLQAAWTPAALRGGEVLVGIDNAFDEEPPEDAFLQGWPFFNRALHDPRGRFFFLSYKHALK